MKDILYFNTLEDIKLIDMMRLSKSNAHDYSKDYLTFEALEDGTFTFTKNIGPGGRVKPYLTETELTSISYSTDNGITWITLTNNGILEAQSITVLNVNARDKILWKGIANTFYKTNGSSNMYCCFSSTCNYIVSGNIMSLLYGDNFRQHTTLPSDYSSNFTSLFSSDTNVISAQNMVLPATTLTANCYYNMFGECTSLTQAPELPATTLAISCYDSMFHGCTSLTTAPELPATTLAEGCYSRMFYNCTSLTTAPELPATILAEDCYSSMFLDCTSLTTPPRLPATTLTSSCYNAMFKGCTSLTTAPELPAITLVSNCYSNMFHSCTILNYIKAMFTTTPGAGYVVSWVYKVAETGTFVKNANATWTTTGVNGIPTGWAVETADA